MITIYIFADSFKHFDDAIREYDKRLARHCRIIQLKPVKKGTSAQIITMETDILKKKLDTENAYKIVLSPNGKSMSTDDFHRCIEEKKQSYPNIILCIGGAHGLDYASLSSYVDMELSLSNFILPHALALTLILEQVYRVYMIERGGDYHK